MHWPGVTEVWKIIETRAKKKGISLHAALGEAILAWVEEAACAPCSVSYRVHSTQRSVVARSVDSVHTTYVVGPSTATAGWRARAPGFDTSLALVTA